MLRGRRSANVKVFGCPPHEDAATRSGARRSENLQRTKPREGKRGRCSGRPAYGDFERGVGSEDGAAGRPAGEQAVVADAVEACGQYVDEEAADELVGGEGHHLVSFAAFDPVVLPLEGDAAVIACDQASIRDGDAVGVAREIA